VGRRGSSLNSNATKNLLCVQSVHSPRFEERMPNTKEMRYQDPSVTDTLQTAGNTEVRYLLMGPEHSSYIRVQLFQHLRVAVSPSSLSPPPPPTDLNIGVESAPLEGHMWPHSQLIRRVQFFFTLSAATCRVKTETANAALNCVVVVGWTCPTLNRWRRHVGIKCCGFMDWRTSCSAWRGNFVHNRSHTAHLALNTELGGKVLMFLTWRTHIGHLIHTSRSVQTDRVGSLSGNVWDTLRKVTRIRSAWFSLGLPANTWKIL